MARMFKNCAGFAVATALLVSIASGQDVRHKRADDDGTLGVVVENLSQHVSTLTAQLTAVNAEIADLKTRAAKDATIIAFHVRHSAYDQFEVLPQGPIILTNVITSTGSGYDAASGFFQAPVPGLYLFVATITCHESTTSASAWVNLMVNDLVLAQVMSEFVPGALDQGTVAAPIHLNKGDSVHLTNGGDAHLILRGSIYTSFSGLLVQSD